MRAERRRRTAAATASALVAAVIAGCGSDPAPPVKPPTPAPAKAGPLRELQRQDSQLLDGGVDAFKARLGELRGYPVVVNQWASWCPPCRREFPYFQRLAARYGTRIAFVGVDSSDNRGDARNFLKKYPTPYPHYFDPDNKVARTFRGGAAWPTTAFYTAGGELSYSHPGGYRSESDLLTDIRRYATR